MNITLLGIFLEGILSFLSPCVLPLLPLYMSYLVGDDKTVDENGNIKYKTINVFLSTLCFVLGICLTFTLLSLAVNSLISYIKDYSEIISIIGGTIIIIFGLHQLGIIHIDLLNKEFKLKVNLHLEKMSFFKAFLLGFVFSLGWSPCIGPMLANALLLAATSSEGYLYLIAYCLGLIIPFLITGLLTSTVLNLIKNKKNIFKWILKIAGIVLIIFGLYMIITSSKQIVTYKKQITEEDQSIEDIIYNLEFVDQNGNKVKLSDYDDKYIFVKFSATWCTYCHQEKDDYLDFASKNDCICLYAMNTSSDSSIETITNYVKENNINIPVFIDDGTFASYCGISSYPTLLIFGPNRKCLTGYPGMMERELFDQIYEYAKQLYEESE